MHLKRHLPARALVVAPLAVIAALAVLTGTAMAARVMIVTQGEIPSSPPKHVEYFHTIQAAVNATKHGDYVLIEPGVYDEEVKVTKRHSHIWIRGMNRNTVIIDGQHKTGNGIEIRKTNDVWVENLTVRNFELSEESCGDEECGNEIWWNGGAGTGKIGAHGWHGSYLTAYDTGMNGGYGIFTGNETEGSWENIYSSGMDDSGMYLGACAECKARISKATMEDDAVGYSGSNSGGELIIEQSVFRNNRAGIVPNSENPGDPPPPSNGACNPAPPYTRHHKVLPTFESTDIEHCTKYRDNLVEDNNNLTTPVNGSTARAPWGVGVEFPGVYADEVEGNTIKGNYNDGFLGFEYPNPYPIQEDTIPFALSGVRVANNKFEENGGAGGSFSRDIMFQGGLFTESTNNCAIGNTTPDGTQPEDLEGAWSCANATTSNPNGGPEALEYVVRLSLESEAVPGEPQPAPGPQETMPNPCEGVPRNPLCE